MKFLTQMKGCDVVTVQNGTVQAIKGPVAYFGYNVAFKNLQFAVDAKMFTATLKKFKSDFYVAERNNKIIFYDATQEVDFVPQPAEILLNRSRVDWHDLPALPKAWNIAQKFVQTDFPGVRVQNGYLEVLSDSSIVRVFTDTKDMWGIYAAIKLPADVHRVGTYNGKMWFMVTPVDLIAVNSLDVAFPSTDHYFNQWPKHMAVIPEVLRDRFVETDLTVFDSEGVKFVQKEKATASIEDIVGSGSYSGKLFGNAITNGKRYTFLENYMAFDAPNIKGIIARV